MSLFCGIFALGDFLEIPGAWRELLRSRLSRVGDSSITEHIDRNLYIAKLDFGAFDAPGWLSDPSHGVTALSGDSIIADRLPSMTRASDVKTLNSTSLKDLPAALRTCRGSFCAALYKRNDRQLALVTDKLGVRPIYWLSNGRYLIFAGALRLLEDVPDLQLTVDIRGAMEAACFGFPLGDRTPYVQVRSLRGGQILTCTHDAGARIENYWRWDTDACAQVTESPDDELAELYAVFGEAVRLRTGNRKAVFSGLTAGLDSRCVVTELRSQGVAVRSINASWPQSAEQVLGRLCAEALGTTHYEALLPETDSGGAVGSLVRETMSAHADSLGAAGGNPKQLWGGNGGSVGVGHVYISPEAVRAIRERGIRSGAEQYLRDNRLSLTKHPFRGSYAAYARGLPLESVTEELERLTCADDARKLYVFLLENDQRRHHMMHFEHIDRVRFEHIEPFYDSEVLTRVCRLPMDFCLRHLMYNEWLRRFPQQIMKAAWQVYPGHEPCPVPQPPNLSYQWGPAGRALHQRQRRDALEGLRFALSHWRPLKEIVRADVVAAAYLAVAFRLSDAFYIGSQVASISRPLVRCEGRAKRPP
jgi:hypothetical protein